MRWLALLAAAVLVSSCAPKHGNMLVGPRYTQNVGTDSAYVVTPYTLRSRPQGPTIIIKTDP